MFSLSPASPLEGLKRDGEKTEYWKYIRAVASLFLSISSLMFMSSADSGTTPALHPVLSSTSSISCSGLQHPSCSSAVREDGVGHTLSQANNGL